jgi:circadian clock protein KaiB
MKGQQECLTPPVARGMALTHVSRAHYAHRLAEPDTDRGGFLSKFLLKLYVAGSSPRAQSAIENLKRICAKDLSGEYELQIIDVLENPELAEQDRILATPTLIKQLPPPLRRVIGDLSDSEKVLLGLELRQMGAEPPSTPDNR